MEMPLRDPEHPEHRLLLRVVLTVPALRILRHGPRKWREAEKFLQQAQHLLPFSVKRTGSRLREESHQVPTLMGQKDAGETAAGRTQV